MIGMLSALTAGLLFGLGLTVAQMIDPAKIVNFLDLAGTWDPSLAFVMGAAVPVAAAGFALARRRNAPLAALRFAPDGKAFDGRAAWGGALFGVGWGLSGYCPGPAVVALGFGHPGTWWFVAAMLAGMGILDVIERLMRRPAGVTAP